MRIWVMDMNFLAKNSLRHRGKHGGSAQKHSVAGKEQVLMKRRCGEV